MKLGILFSGGKDSTLALHLAAKKDTIACLITVFSRNKESFMFHTPNIDISSMQAQALGLPQIRAETEGKKEEELIDLEQAIIEAKDRFGIEGIVTGAVQSVYQSSRVKRICNNLGLGEYSPLWKMNPQKLLETLVAEKYKVIISGVFAYQLDEKWLGRQIDKEMISRLAELQSKYGISPSGEGGEIETTVLDAPLFKQSIQVTDAKLEWSGSSGVYVIKAARLTSK